MQVFPKLDRYLLGDNPFIGIDHLSQERVRERDLRLNQNKILGVIDAAMANGAQGFLFTTHQVIYDALRQMKERMNGTSFGMYPILPYAQKYVRFATEKGLVGLAKDVLSELSWKSKIKLMAEGSVAFAELDPERMLRTYVDAEIDMLRKNAPTGASLKSILLHEVLTDLAVSFEADQLLKSYSAHIIDSYGVMPGFVTRNFTRFVSFAKKSQIPLDETVILTPFNKVGFQMNPSRQSCEQTLASLDSNVIAMSILAAGFLGLSEALDYLRERTGIKAFVVGVSTQEHAKATFSEMQRVPVA